MPSVEFTSETQTSTLNGGLVVIDFWADWCKPCGPMNATFDQLADNYPNIKFVKIEAEKYSDITEKFQVAAVPTFIFLKDGKLLDKIEGANGPDLVSKLTKYNQQATASKEDLNTRLQKLVNYAPVMLFMKGNASAPQCGFSNKIVEILKKENIQFSTFNILSDEEVRQGLKTYSNWPTFPQLYANGKLIGGLDIVKEMAEDGELQSVIPDSAKGTSNPVAVNENTGKAQTPEAPKEDLNARLQKLTNDAPVMIFIKGAPEAPKCGFSSKLVNILNENKVKYGSFDILGDNEVREGLKKFSNWPTYPQLYVNGKLVGGLDIVKELADDGELVSMIPESSRA